AAEDIGTVVASGDRVFHVGGGHRTAVLEAETFTQPIGPSPSSVGGFAERLGQVGYQTLPGLTGCGVEGDQGAADEPEEVPGVGVVGVSGVQRVEVVGAGQPQGSARLVTRPNHAGDRGVPAGLNVHRSAVLS